MKTCFKCLKTLPLSEFYKHPAMEDGHVNKCKSCNKRDVKLNRLKNFDHYREFEYSRNKTPERREKRKTYNKNTLNKNPELKKKVQNNYRRKYPEKYLSHYLLSNALRDGKIKKKDFCEICGSNHLIQGHHEDYSKPLDVIWLCKKCHTNIHDRHLRDSTLQKLQERN